MTRQRPIVPVIVVVLAVALVGLLVYGVVHGGANTSLDDAVKAGTRPAAPGAGLKRPLLDGSGQRSLADYKGQVVVLNFWASWCGPCRKEAPVLQRAQEQLARTRVGTVLGATYNDAVDDARRFESELRVGYPSVRDISTDLASKYGTRALPETFVIDRQGRVVAISRGQISQRFIDRALAMALGPSDQRRAQ